MGTSLRNAEQGDASSQYNVAIFYHYGTGVAESGTEAFKWYRRAAEQNDSLAQRYVGNCYSQGDGVAVDKQEALKWLRKSADQGHEASKETLKEMEG